MGLGRRVAVASEVQWTRIPNALAGSVAKAFDEDDLGRTPVRVQVIIGH